MSKIEYQLLKFIQTNRSVCNQLQAFCQLGLPLNEGARALAELRNKRYILGGLFWNYITPRGQKALQDVRAAEAFEIEILI